MRKPFLLWLLVFALIVQSIGQTSAGRGMYHTAASSAGKASALAQAAGDPHAAHIASVSINKPSCHEAIHQPAGEVLVLQTEDPQSPQCPCCDDDCSMPRCPALFLGLANRLDLAMIDVGTEMHVDVSTLLINRLLKPPTPPPNQAQI